MKTNRKTLALFIFTFHILSYIWTCFADSLTWDNSLTWEANLDVWSYVLSSDSANATWYDISWYNLTWALSAMLLTWDDSMNETTEEEVSDEEMSPTVSRRAKSIEWFRDKQKNIINWIYENTNIWMLMDVEAAGKQLQTLSNDFRDISKDFEKVQARKDRVDEKYQQLKDTIKQILANINETKSMVNQRIEKINAYSKKIVTLRDQVKSIESEIDSTKSYLVNYTNLLYKINNDYYGSDLNIDDIKLLAKSNNIAQSLSTEDVIKSLTVKLDELLQIMRERHESYVDFSQQINDIRIKYKYEVEKYTIEIETMNQQKKSLLDLLRYIKEDKISVDNEYNNLFENQNNIKDKISDLISISKNWLDNMKTPSWLDLSPLVQAKDQEDSDKYFSWPVLPAKRITTFFNDPSYKKIFWVDHKWLDLASSQWNSVYAPANWMVYKVIDQNSAWLNWMIVIHKYWYITIYLHMNRIVVKEWDFVKRWQILWASWGTPWTRWAWLLSTGPHLHYEILKNWEAIDPLIVTDLSVISSKDLLQSKHHVKWVKDRFARKISLTNIQYIEWRTLQERRRKFLAKYGNWPFADLALWEDAAKSTNVDVDMWICIWFAESGLWHHLASKWNVWNVWNNDRGDRRWFNSPLEWATAIYMWLSNKYLSRHYTIDQLSRFGNQEWPLYASSPLNWEKNLVNCLSKIKWYWVPENYSFRNYTPWVTVQ